MSVGIKPYLGTGLAEMLAQRGLEERASRMRQQEAMAPGLMQALAPAVELAAIGDPSMLQNAMRGLQEAGIQTPFGGGLAAMLGGPAAPPGAPVAQPATTIAGLDPNLVRQLGLSGARQLKAQELGTQIAAGREQKVTEAKGVADFVKTALSGAENAARRKATISQIRQKLPQAQLGLTSKAGLASIAGRAVGVPELGEAAKSPATKEVLAQATNLYNTIRTSETGQRLFSQEVPRELQATVFNTPEQIEALLSAVEMASEFDTLVADLTQKVLAATKAQGRTMTAEDQASIIEVANELIRQRYPDKEALERNLQVLQ